MRRRLRRLLAVHEHLSGDHLRKPERFELCLLGRRVRRRYFYDSKVFPRSSHDANLPQRAAGCQPKACPQGQVYRSAKDLNCVSIGECRGALCMLVDGVMYAEGDVMEKDACHAW